MFNVTCSHVYATAECLQLRQLHDSCSVLSHTFLIVRALGRAPLLRHASPNCMMGHILMLPSSVLYCNPLLLRIRMQEEGGHLRTAAMREAEARAKAQSYGLVAVRLLLPGSTATLQAAFPATDSLSALQGLLARVLSPQAAAAAYLFTTPPKTVIKGAALQQSFYQAGLVPAARVHVGVDAAKGGCWQQYVLAHAAVTRVAYGTL